MTFAEKVKNRYNRNRYNRNRYNFENVVFTERQFYHKLINLKTTKTIFKKRENLYKDFNCKSRFYFYNL